MSFGKNPFVARAEAAELKAENAPDDLAREQAWLEAGRQWDRAADRERDAARREEYVERAAAARANVDE
jgi:hypothetical protein